MFRTSSNRNLKRHQIAKRYLLACVLALGSLLLTAQGIELSHSHDNLQSQLDCQICFKQGSKGKVLLSSGLNIEIQASIAFSLESQPAQPFVAVPPAKSRAPPGLSNS